MRSQIPLEMLALLKMLALLSVSCGTAVVKYSRIFTLIS